ncbi:MAG TPA: efflux RND transporter periplasmic adaptor subunit [Gemmatimonadales bacterium]|nr:efflux RND transporter periplasmic adaptor subunit [Gemmatimonadales bacterium]
MSVDLKWPVALAVLAAVAGCGRRPAATAAAPGDSLLITVPEAQRGRITVATVTPQPFAPVVEANGVVAFDGDQSTPVLAPISGPVTRILVEPGAVVRAGQPLAYVASPDFAAAMAGYRKAAATARQLQRVADLNEKLYQNDGISRRDLEQSQTDAVSAAADRDAALEQLRALGVDDSTLAALQADRPVPPPPAVIRAPLAGTVVERLITPGQLLQAGSTPCFTVADLSRMWVMTSVFEPDLPDVHRGDRAEVRPTAGGTAYAGTVDNIAAEVDSDTKATAVRVVVPNRGGLLKKDMYVRVAVRSSRTRTGILVPVGAVLRDDDNQPFVFVAAARAGAFERRTVTLGERVGDVYDILQGLRPGDRVVTGGGLFLQFAQGQ